MASDDPVMQSWSWDMFWAVQPQELEQDFEQELKQTDCRAMILPMAPNLLPYRSSATAFSQWWPYFPNASNMLVLFCWLLVCLILQWLTWFPPFSCLLAWPVQGYFNAYATMGSQLSHALGLYSATDKKISKDRKAARLKNIWGNHPSPIPKIPETLFLSFWGLPKGNIHKSVRAYHYVPTYVHTCAHTH